MDSGNIDDALNELSQPGPAVVADSEVTGATPQAAATEEVEFYVESEGDQSTEPNKMDERQTRAAWKEEKRKRKERTEEAKKETERADRLERELKELQSQVSNVTRGKRPDPYDFDSTEDYHKADDAWRGHGKTEDKPSTTAQQPAAYQLSEDQEFHLDQSERKLKASLKDYDEVRSSVSDSLAKTFNGDGPTLIRALSAIAHTFDVDPAKAFYALDKMPGKLDDLLKNSNNQAQVGKILRDLESKVKVRERKPINSKPEPNIKGGGPVNVLQKEVDNAFEAYKENPNTRNHALLTAARNKVKQAKVS